MTRFTLPQRFVNERAAENEMHGFSLWTLGGRIVPEGNRFRIVIDTLRPRGVQRYLKQHMPGVEWAVTEMPE